MVSCHRESVIDSREQRFKECKFRVQAQGEEHKEKENCPELGKGQKADGLWIGDKSQTLLLFDHILNTKRN